MTAAAYTVGDRVIGLGRLGADWPTRPTGVVTSIFTDGWVRVAWDDTVVEDDMHPTWLQPEERT